MDEQLDEEEKLEIPSFKEYEKKRIRNFGRKLKSFFRRNFNKNKDNNFSSKDIKERKNKISEIRKNKPKEKGTFHTSLDIVKEAWKTSHKDMKRNIGYTFGEAVCRSAHPWTQKMLFGSLSGLVSGYTIPFYIAGAVTIVRNRLDSYCKFKAANANLVLNNTFHNSSQYSIYEKELRKSKPYFKINAPDAISKTISAVSNAKNDILNSSIKAISHAVVFGITSVSLFSVNPALAAGVLGCTLTFRTLGTKLNKIYRNVRDKVFLQGNNISKKNIDSIKNTPLIQATNRVKDETDVIKKRLDQSSKNVQDLAYNEQKLNLKIVNAISMVMEVGIIVAAADDVMQTGDIGRFALISGASWQMLSSGANFADIWNRLQRNVQKYNDSSKKLIMPKALERTTGKEQLAKEDTKIELKDVSFAYPDYNKDVTQITREEAEKQLNIVTRGEEVLHNVNVTFDKGSLISIVGESGNGKSTLMNLMRHDYDTQYGVISISGKDITTIDDDSFNRQVALLDQNVHFFDQSIKENLLYFKKDATDEELNDVCRRVGLSEDIQKFEDGLDYKIGQDGSKLSGGQRQRLALARIILADTPIILLDEPTTGLDGNKTIDVVNELKNLAHSGKTVVMVTHNPTEIALSDRCVLLSGGKIVADGKPENLLETDYMKGVMTKEGLREKREIYEKVSGNLRPEKESSELFLKEETKVLTDDELKNKRALLEMHKKVFVATRKRQLLKDRKQKGLPLPEKKKREPLNPPSAYKPIDESTSIR